jgi:hypothetical protein
MCNFHFRIHTQTHVLNLDLCGSAPLECSKHETRQFDIASCTSSGCEWMPFEHTHSTQSFDKLCVTHRSTDQHGVLLRGSHDVEDYCGCRYPAKISRSDEYSFGHRSRQPRQRFQSTARLQTARAREPHQQHLRALRWIHRRGQHQRQNQHRSQNPRRVRRRK